MHADQFSAGINQMSRESSLRELVIMHPEVAEDVRTKLMLRIN